MAANTTSIKVSPVALVLHTGKGREKGTTILIRLGQHLLATAKLGGTWDEKQALAEWRKQTNKNFIIKPTMEELHATALKM